jgi:integral membrane sensor domain MASE1
MVTRLRDVATDKYTLRYLAWGIGLVAAVMAAALLPSYVSLGGGAPKPIPTLYAVTGLALAALLIVGTRYWPAIWLGAGIVALRAGSPFWLALCVASGIALQAWAGCHLLQRLVGFRNSFNRIADVVGFVIFGMGISPLIGTAISITAMVLSGGVAGPNFVSTWWLWWLESATGILLITPMLLVWFSNELPPWPRSQVMEGVVLLVLVAVVGG